MIDVDAKLAELRNLVRELDATGSDGFEGLMAVVLGEISHTLFRLAKSGSQHGKDGQSAHDAGAVLFEAKLYDKEVHKNEVLSKVTEILAWDDGAADLWILGSTGTVATQDADTVEAVGKKGGFATLIADWSEVGLPTLATLLAMAPAGAAKFIADHAREDETTVRAILDAVQAHPQYVSRAQELKGVLEQPSIGPAYALRNNRLRFREAFASTKRARLVFGQPLAPADCERSAVDRTALRQQLATAAFGKPDDSVVAILGLEGNGKSWLFAQAWMHEAAPPLTIILLSEDIPASSTPEAAEELLVSKLIAQTDDTPTEAAKQRWRRHLERWRRANQPDRPRLLVYLDGVNQRSGIHWARTIDTLSDLVWTLGGGLLFSSRTPFFREHIRPRLASRIVPVEVVEWTVAELEGLLNARGTSTDKLRPEVVNSLRNPRIFSIAAELFQNDAIESFSELSVSRLLFEHIRTSAAASDGVEDPFGFARQLRDHANEIIARLRSKSTADLKVFEAKSAEEQFAAVSSGRFFRSLEDEPTSYQLTDEGLPLALGLSLVSAAKRALRNGSNIENALAAILDPIAALDQTAEILLTAVSAAVLDDRAQVEVTAGLVAAYVGLQNLDVRRFQEFQALAREAPAAFLLALERIGLAGRAGSNNSWLMGALIENRSDGVTFKAIRASVERWLSMYSDSPERLMMIPKRDATEAERAAEYQKRKQELEDKRMAFSDAERQIWKTFVRQDDGEFSNLSRIAFQLLAGLALAPFVDALRNWALVDVYAGAAFSADREFRALLQLNRIDWVDMRAALLTSLQVLRASEISPTGRRALIRVLYANGSSDDAKEGATLAAVLSSGAPEGWKGWSWLEQLCATDPCDPDSQRPNNIDSTAATFEKLDVTALSRSDGMAPVDRLFEGAISGLARFAPDPAVGIIRAFAANALTRTNEEFVRPVFALSRHSCALDETTAKAFIAKAAGVAQDGLREGDEYHERWAVAQTALAIAFSHLTGEEQLEALVSHPPMENLLLELTDLFQACSPVSYDAHLEQAFRSGDQTAQFRILAFGQFTQTEIGNESKAIVGQLISSSCRFVRLATLGLTCRLNDRSLLQRLSASAWNAADHQSAGEKFEVWYGSEALALAAGQGLLSVEECLRRISISGYSRLIRTCGRDAALAIAGRLDTSLAKATTYPMPVALPDIELRLARQARPGLFHITERQAPDGDLRNLFTTFAQGTEGGRMRDRQNRETAEDIERELNQAGAELICEAVTADLMEEIAKFAPSTIRAWCGLFLGLEREPLGRVHNVALLVARVLSREDAQSAVALFEKLDGTFPPIRVTVGAAGIPIAAESVWNAADNADIQRLRFARLDRARNDHEIAIEVLAALSATKGEALRDYVLDRRARPEPFHVARAAMVAGFSQGSPWAADTIEALRDCYGLLSSAYEAATHALSRHRWSTHWAWMMSESKAELDLWRFGTLLGVIVDGRCIDCDQRVPSQETRTFMRYRPTFDDTYRRRVNRWKEKRSKQLFGTNAPDPTFLR
jgi:hypothetical protein